jgi:hypothetical protein
MTLNGLTADEREVVRRSLVAAAEGRYFPDWEFQTLFGVTRVQVAEVLRAWPAIDESREFVQLAINNTFSNLLGYPHGKTGQLERELGVTTTRLEQVFTKWRNS